MVSLINIFLLQIICINTEFLGGKTVCTKQLPDSKKIHQRKAESMVVFPQFLIKNAIIIIFPIQPWTNVDDIRDVFINADSFCHAKTFDPPPLDHSPVMDRSRVLCQCRN